MSDLVKPQPPPTGNGATVTELVIADLRAKSEAGTKKYGTPLRVFNGRDALVDLYQELIDAVQYCRQALEERLQRSQHTEGEYQALLREVEELRQRMPTEGSA